MNKMQRLFAVSSIVFLICGMYFVFFESNDVTTITNVESEKISSVFIHISGEVKNSDMYQFDHMPRVKEVIDAAGGLSKDADEKYIQKNLNYAQLLQDQTKLYIPKIGENIAEEVAITTNSNKSSNDSISKKIVISMNSSSLKELDSLPGIGEITAKKIISNRPYGSLDELVFKKILKNSVYQKIKENISL